MKISLCMIVRDEASCLDRCLSSARDVVDEICIIDTGSDDDTVEIARSYGARVESFAWVDDFSAARNASLDLASGDWVLVLDADEALESVPGGSAQVREQLERFATDNPELAGQVTIVDRQEQGDLSCRVSRFFPRELEPRYAGRFHEQPHFGDAPAAARSTGVSVAHEGYRADTIASKGKVARNLRFLEQLVAEEPRDSYYWYQLGRTHLVAEDLEPALDAFTSALDHVDPGAPYLALLCELTGHTLRGLGRSLEALSLLQQVSGAFLDRADTCYLEGLLALDVGELELAETRLQRCLTLPPADGVGGASAEAARAWGPAYHLGVLRECLDMPDEAREYYARALDLRPGHAESLAGLARIDQRRG